MKILLAIFAFVITLPANAATVNSVTVTQDLGAGTAAFQMIWNTAPDFFTSIGNAPADSFQFYVGDSPPFIGITQSIIRGDEIRFTNSIVIRNSYPYTNDFGGGGWGAVRGSVPYSLNGNVLDFIVPFLLLGSSDRYDFFYWEVYNFGSMVQHSALSNVPLPAALFMFAPGFIALWLVVKRRG